MNKKIIVFILLSFCASIIQANSLIISSSNSYDYNQKGELIHTFSYSGFEEWYFYDDAGNEIKYENSSGFSYYKEYEGGILKLLEDSNGQIIEYDNYRHITHSKSSNLEMWFEYEEHGLESYYKDSFGNEQWTKYFFDDNDKLIKKEVLIENKKF